MESEALAVNELDHVVGWSRRSPGGEQRAFFFDGEEVHDIGSLGGSSTATGINDRDQVVGRSSTGPATGLNRDHAFLWDAGVMLDLNDLIPPESGWTLTHAFEINNDGQIAGIGLIDGEEHAYLLTPRAVPEPTALAVLALGAGALGVRRWRMQRAIDRGKVFVRR